MFGGHFTTYHLFIDLKNITGFVPDNVDCFFGVTTTNLDRCMARVLRWYTMS